MNTKDEHAEFVEGFLIAADTDGTGDEMIKDIEESPLPLGCSVAVGRQGLAASGWRVMVQGWCKMVQAERRGDQRTG